MSTTQPIRTAEEIKVLKEYFLEKKEIRNYTLITLGINTSLRISDLLKLKWRDVYDFKTRKYRKHITVIEQKTGKTNIVALNEQVIFALKLLAKQLGTIRDEEFLIKSRCGNNKAIGRTRAFDIIRSAAHETKIEEHISCHSLRKTFGYHAWKKGVPPILIMTIYNHSSLEITKRYLSIDQDDKDEVFLNINL